MQERHLCWSPNFFPWPRSAPPSFFILELPLDMCNTALSEFTKFQMSFNKSVPESGLPINQHQKSQTFYQQSR